MRNGTHRHRRRRGISLVEVLTAGAISTMMILPTLTFQIGSARLVRSGMDEITAQTDAQAVIRRISADVRSGQAVLVADSNATRLSLAIPRPPHQMLNGIGLGAGPRPATLVSYFRDHDGSVVRVENGRSRRLHRPVHRLEFQFDGPDPSSVIVRVTTTGGKEGTSLLTLEQEVFLYNRRELSTPRLPPGR